MAVVFAAVGAILFVRLGDTLDERIADTLEARTSALASTFDVSSPVVSGEEGLAQVIESDGSIVSGTGSAETSPLLTSAELERARVGSIGVETEISDADYRLQATPVDDRIVVVGEPLDDRDEALDGLFDTAPSRPAHRAARARRRSGTSLRAPRSVRSRAMRRQADLTSRRRRRTPAGCPFARAHDEVYRLGETLNEMLDRLDAGLERERRFVADASHELRTPLAALRTELELAARRPRTPADLEDALRSASEEVERLVILAEDLLVLARSDEGGLALDVGRHDVRAMLDAVAARNDTRAVMTARALAVAAPADLAVLGDRRRLEQALGILVDNAFRHGEGTVRLEGSLVDSHVALAVSDEGTGFPPEFLPSAFERFSRADAIVDRRRRRSRPRHRRCDCTRARRSCCRSQIATTAGAVVTDCGPGSSRSHPTLIGCGSREGRRLRCRRL